MTDPRITQGIGWVATAIFTSSYFFQDPQTLLGLQVVAASTWIVFGVLVKQKPVIVANVLVAAGALISALRH